MNNILKNNEQNMIFANPRDIDSQLQKMTTVIERMPEHLENNNIQKYLEGRRCTQESKMYM